MMAWNVLSISSVAALCLFFTIPIRIISRKFLPRIPVTYILFSISVIMGSSIYIFGDRNGIPLMIKLPAEVLPATYLPIYIFSIIYNSDHYIFMRCLPQVIITCLFIFIGTISMIGIIVKDVLHHKFDIQMGLLTAVFCIPIQPNNIVILLKDLAKYKYLGTILEAEALLTSVPVLISLQSAFGYFDKSQTKWYQFFMVRIRYYVFASILGYAIGKVTSKLMGLYYNIPKNVVTISISMCFLTYFLAEFICFTSGPLAVIILSYHVKLEKHKFTAEVEKCMTHFWVTLSYISENIFLMILGAFTIYYAWVFMRFEDMVRSIILFFCGNIVRLIMFIILYPIMNFLHYNIDVRGLLVLSWSGVKGSLNLMLIFITLTSRSTSAFCQHVLIEILLYTYLTICLNSSTMQFVVSLLGMTELSSSRKINMNNCLQFIMQKRTYNIDLFKLNRYLSDVNWKVVRRKTILRHPYTAEVREERESGEIEEEEKEDEEEHAAWEPGTLICPDCVNEVPYDVSEKEIKEMIQEAHIKILKAKKVSIIKQYENGVINKNCLQMLVHTFEVMIDSNSETNTIYLRSYMKKNKMLAMLYGLISFLNNESLIFEPPNPLWRRLCFYIVMHIAYNYVMFIRSLIFTIVHIIALHELDFNRNLYNYLIANTMLAILEIIVKVVALSEQNIYQGLNNFFKFKLNILDLCIIILQILCIVIRSMAMSNNVYTLKIYWILIMASVILVLLKIVDLLKPLYSKWLKILEYKMDSKICFGYDLATALVNCCDEVLLIIGHIIEVNIIKSLYIKELQLEKGELLKIMEEVQSDRSYIAITVKTKQTVRTTLNAMEDSLNDLKISGYVDNMEYLYIYKEIFDKQNFLRNLKFVKPSSPKRLFCEVPWMVEDKVKDYLFNHAEKVFWNRGEEVCKVGKTPPGIYIFIGGLLRLTYTPSPSAIANINSSGSIPIIDYYATIKFDETWHDRITTGNSVGELSFLTGRPYDCTIIADTSSQAYFLSTEVMNRAIKFSRDPINGLEAKLWKCSTINLAFAVLTSVPLYNMLGQEQIKVRLQRAFMPNISCYKMFVITDMMDAVILIEGVAADYSLGDLFVAPMHIPRTTQKLILPRSSYLNLDDRIITKLLVIPVANAEVIDIMTEEEELAEFVPSPSSSCLIRVKDGQRASAKLRRKKNVEPLLNKPSAFSLSNFEDQVKFEVIEPAPSTSSSETMESDMYRLQLLTHNKNVNELQGPD